MIYVNTKYLFKRLVIAMCICIATILSSCSNASTANEVCYPTEGIGATDDSNNKRNGMDEVDDPGTNISELQMPSLSQEDLLGNYDPKIMVRLTSMTECMDFDIDEDATKYMYNIEAEDGTIREVKWYIESEEDEAIWNPPGIGNTYHINQYDRNGNLVLTINRQLISGNIETTSIDLYERTNSGSLKAIYTYRYDDYEWEYMLHYKYVYKNSKYPIYRITYNVDTYTPSSAEIFTSDNRPATKEIIYDNEGNAKYYTLFEYNSNRDIIKEIRYNSENEFEYHVEREYDDNHHVLKTYGFASDGTLTGYAVYSWSEDFSSADYTSYDVEGNETGSGKM